MILFMFGFKIIASEQEISLGYSRKIFWNESSKDLELTVSSDVNTVAHVSAAWHACLVPWDFAFLE